MDFTPEKQHVPQDSGCLSDSFDNSSLFESTPVKINSSHKRKISHIGIYSSEPQFSSTFNESLVNNLAHCHINLEQSAKLFLNDLNTPTKKQKLSHSQKNIYQLQSPAKESRDILYEEIKSVSLRKIQTPQKLCVPTKKRLFSDSCSELFYKVVVNDVIMANVFKYLSDNDLFRVGIASELMGIAILCDKNARERYVKSRNMFTVNKENYKITPPNSPEKNDSPPHSPNSKRFHDFLYAARSLNSTQSLIKCPICEKPSVVENKLGQCKNFNCGYIFCLLCTSFSTTGPENFVDLCKNSSLLINNKSRSNLGDISNFSNDSTNFFSNISKCDSGFHSESDNSLRVKKNLITSFKSIGEKKVLSVNNTSRIKIWEKKRRNTEIVPVVAFNKTIESVDSPPPSPPKVKIYSVGSKQSKRNLKRATK